MKNTEIGNIIYVQIDWGSTALWVPRQSERGEYLANASYDFFDLPEDLLNRFNFWGKWFDYSEPLKSDEENRIGRQLFNSYGLALAVDLKRLLGNDYRIFFGAYADCVEIIFVGRKYGEAVPIAVPKK